MREILFRGKRTDNGEWVHGSLVITTIEPADDAPYKYYRIDDMTVGVFPNDFQCGLSEIVAPETIGQYTGLTDKNGTKIFEGDIIKSHYRNAKKADFIEQVVFHNGQFCSLYKMPGAGNGKMWANLPDGVPRLPQDKSVYMEICEVIGNIYDNPELLGGADNGE